MRKPRTILAVLILAFLLILSACSSDSPTDSVSEASLPTILSVDAYQNWVPATVEFQGEEYVVYYQIDFWPRIEPDWKNADRSTIYHLRDEATKSDYLLDFRVSVWFRDGKEDFVSFAGWDEFNPDSFLQRIVVNNTEEEGEKIFFDFIEQIKSQNPDLP